MTGASGGGMGGINIGGIIAGLINTGVQTWGASQQQDALRRAAEAIRAAEYEPIDVPESAWQAINTNKETLPEITRMALTAAGDLSKYNRGEVRKDNEFITADALKRAQALIPNYTSAMKTYADAGSDLLAGRLPYDDVLDIVADRGSLSGAMGIPGTAAPATLRDLGLSRMQAMQSGGGILQNMVSIAETISPRASYRRPEGFAGPVFGQMLGTMALDPSEVIQTDLEQAGREYQSSQGILNARAQRAQAQAYADNLVWQALRDSSTQALAAYSGAGGGMGSMSPGTATSTTFPETTRFGGTYQETYNDLPVYRPSTKLSYA